MTDAHEATRLIETWWGAVDSVTGLLESLPEEAWRRSTDLPGWDVHAVAAHLAHLESVLAGLPQPPDPDPGADGPHVRGPLGVFCEAGVRARRDTTPDRLVAELRHAARARRDGLRADPPDLTATTRPFPGVDWSWRTLLGNRVLDVWVHEQDVRRAVALPDDLRGPAAEHSLRQLSGAFGVTLARRARAAPGTTAALDVTGGPRVTVTVTDEGRARPATPHARPTLTLSMGRETFLLLAAGRRAEAAADVRIDGDTTLGRAVAEGLTVTP